MDPKELEDLRIAIAVIHERNKRVEADKAWEISKTRICFLAMVTYIVTSLTLFLIGDPHFVLNGCVAALGFYLSTHSLPWIKRWWVRRMWEREG